jgi:hypothetical protein
MTKSYQLTQSRNMRRIVQAARLDRRLAEYWAAVDYDGGPGDEPELEYVTAAEHYQLQAWLRHHKPATF